MCSKILQLPIYDNNRNIITNLDVVLDSEIYEIVSQDPKWQCNYHGHIWRVVRSYTVNKKKRTEFLHNFVWTYFNKPLLNKKEGYTLDHLNRNPLDNRLENLQPKTRSQQNRNTKGKSNSTSKYKGVFWNTGKQRWILEVQIEDKRIYKHFKVELEAAKLHDKLVYETYGKNAYLNFPEDYQ